MAKRRKKPVTQSRAKRMKAFDEDIQGIYTRVAGNNRAWQAKNSQELAAEQALKERQQNRWGHRQSWG